MSGSLPDMKKVNAREFQKAFSKVAQELGQGETVEVTRHGKPLGFFTKARERRAALMPDFAANLAAVPLIGRAGEQIMAMTLDEPLS
jgi:antitoxin (DNA-binding transcriptional repressor) of toxin-antitoxin stability system